DRTPGQQLYPKIQKKLDEYNAGLEDSSGKKTRPRLVVRRVDPSGPEGKAIAEQRFALSEEVRKGKLIGFLDIGPEVMVPNPGVFDARKGVKEDADDRFIVRYHTNRITFMDFSQLAN